MSTQELVLNMMAGTTTMEISKNTDPQTFKDNLEVAKSGGETAAVEYWTGKPVITSKNAAQRLKLLMMKR